MAAAVACLVPRLAKVRSEAPCPAASPGKPRTRRGPSCLIPGLIYGQLRASPAPQPRFLLQPLSVVLKFVALPVILTSQVTRKVASSSWPNSAPSGEMASLSDPCFPKGLRQSWARWPPALGAETPAYKSVPLWAAAGGICAAPGAQHGRSVFQETPGLQKGLEAVLRARRQPACGLRG